MSGFETLAPELVALLRANTGSWRELQDVKDRDPVDVRVESGDQVSVVKLAGVTA